MNIAVLVSGGGTNLQALIDAQTRGELSPGRLRLVVSSRPDAYALTRAANAGIECAVVDKSNYPDREAFTSAIMAELASCGIDLVVFAGFNYVLSPSMCEVYRNRMINVHPALIPAFSGMGFYGLKIHQAVLDYGVKLTGATVHFVNEDCDSGPIILQKAIPVLDSDTPESLQKRVMEQCEWVLLPQAVGLFCMGMLEVDGRWVNIHEPNTVSVLDMSILV